MKIMAKKTYFNLDLIDITSRAQTLKMVVFFQVGPPEQCGYSRRKIQCNVDQTWPCEGCNMHMWL